MAFIRRTISQSQELPVLDQEQCSRTTTTSDAREGGSVRPVPAATAVSLGQARLRAALMRPPAGSLGGRSPPRAPKLPALTGRQTGDARRPAPWLPPLCSPRTKPRRASL